MKRLRWKKGNARERGDEKERKKNLLQLTRVGCEVKGNSQQPFLITFFPSLKILLNGHEKKNSLIFNFQRKRAINGDGGGRECHCCGSNEERTRDGWEVSSLRKEIFLIENFFIKFEVI